MLEREREKETHSEHEELKEINVTREIKTLSKNCEKRVCNLVMQEAFNEFIS